VPVVPHELVEVVELLADLQRFSAMNATMSSVRSRPQSALTRERTDANRIRLAMLFTHAHTVQDDQRALQLLETLRRAARVSGPQATRRVLHAQVAERLRAVRDEQQKATLPCRSSSAAGDGTQPAARPGRSGGGGGGGVGAAAGGAAAREGAESSEAHMASSGEILLVDDDPDLLKLISLRLTSAGTAYARGQRRDGAGRACGRAAGRHYRPPDAGHRRLQLFDAIHRNIRRSRHHLTRRHIPDAVSATQRRVGFLTKPFDSQDFCRRSHRR